LATNRLTSLTSHTSVVLRFARNLYELGEPVYNIPMLDWPSLSDQKDWYLLDLLLKSNADGLITRDKRILEAGKHLGMPVFDLQGGAVKRWY
jgi:predicted nucleic acid-binding protein